MPCTLSDGSTTASGSMPILQVPAGCQLEAPYRRIFEEGVIVVRFDPASFQAT